MSAEQKSTRSSMAQDTSDLSKSGFHGSVGSLPLVDLLQVWSMNRFAGLVTVTLRDRRGHLYFVEGEIVHAESGAQVGEPAVREILGWPEGAFELYPNTTTLHRTIQKRLSHLLLDAHRVLDEDKRDARPAPPPQPPQPPPLPPSAAARPSLFDQIRAIRGVELAVRFGADGRPLGDAGPGAEQLAARGLYLAMTHAAAVASAFGLRELAIATLQSEHGPLVLVHAHGSYLCVAVAPGVATDQVAAQLRALLTRQGGK
jgi:hypothetical protein